jgi:hypothetical protein
VHSHLRFEIKSTVDMAAILNRQFIGSSVLSLEKGPIDGTVQILPLPNLRLVLIELNKKVAFCADRKAGKYHFRSICRMTPFATMLWLKVSLLLDLQYLALTRN